MRRGCGARRDPGTIYSTWLSRKKDPSHRKGMLKYFLWCPPWVVFPEQLGLTSSGVKIIERSDGSGIFDIYDVIGREHYPWFTDFFVEADAMGTSRKIARTSRFDLLSPESQHLYIFSLGSLVDPTSFYKDRLDIEQCPLGHEHHDRPVNGFYEMCTALLWEAVEKYEEPRVYNRAIPFNRPKNESPIAVYQCARMVKGDHEWEWAALLHTPIEFEVVADPLSSIDDQAMEVLANADNGIPYMMVED